MASIESRTSASAARASAGIRRGRARHQGLLDHSLGIHAHAVGEGRVSLQQQHAIANLYATHPADDRRAHRAPRPAVLSGGLQVTRGGEVADLKPAFKRHLERHWLPFARDVIDSFLAIFASRSSKGGDGGRAAPRAPRRRGAR